MCGPPGCGKTEQMLSRYVADVRQGGFDAAVLIVPSARVARRISRRLLTEKVFAGLMDARIFTFPDLAESLLRANHVAARELTRLQQELVMRRVVVEVDTADGLAVLGASLDTPGLIRALLDFIEELKRAAIRPDEFARGLRAADLQRPLDKDLCAVYARYQQALTERQLYDAAGKFWEARDLLEAGKMNPLGEMKTLYVDGFADFTTTQLQVLAHLAAFARKTTISLPYDDSEAREEVRCLPEQTLKRIKEAMPEAACEEAQLSSCPNDALAHLRSQLFAIEPSDPPEDAANQIELVEADSPRAEMAGIAAEVKRLLLDGVRAADICVAFRQSAKYRSLLAQMLDEHGVPYCFSTGDVIVGQPLVQTVMSLLNIATGDYRREDVVNFLRSELVDLSSLQEDGKPDSDTVFAVACDAGIVRGRQQWTDALALRQRLLRRDLQRLAQKGLDTDDADASERAASSEEEVAASLQDAEAVGRLITRLMEALDGMPQTGTVAEHVEALAKLLKQFGMGSSDLTKRARGALANPANMRAFDALCQSLDEWREMAALTESGTEMSAPEFVTELNQLVRQVEFEEGTREQGRLEVVDVHDLRQVRGPYLFLADVAEGSFPATYREDVFYSEIERKRLSERAGFDLRSRPNNEMEEAFLFHEAVSAATKRLYLSYANAGDDGNPVLASAYFDDVRRVLDERVKMKKRPKTTVAARACDTYGVRQLREYAFWRLHAPALNDDQEQDGLRAWNLLCELDAEIVPHAALGAAAETRRYSREPFDHHDGVLDDAALIARMREDWGPEHDYSASQLGSYGKCPFRFFLERVLELDSVQEPDEEIDRGQRGLLAHRILQNFLTDWLNNDSHPRAILEDNLADAETALAEAADRVFADHERQNLVAHQRLWEMTQEELRTDLAAFPVAEAQANASKDEVVYEPLWLEVGYGYGNKPALVNDREGEQVRIRGWIDRLDLVVDANGEVVGFAVFDYKTGSSVPGPKEMMSGTDLQLAIYMMAGEEMLEDDNRGLECLLAAYYKVVNGGAKRQPQITPDGRNKRDEILGTAKDHIAEFAGSIRAGRFPVNPKTADVCRSCDFRSVCRYVQWRCREKKEKKGGTADE